MVSRNATPTGLNLERSTLQHINALQQDTHRLVGHDADAVGEVASHHARYSLCLEDVLQTLPHAAVGLRIRRVRGQRSAAISRQLLRALRPIRLACCWCGHQQLAANSDDVKSLLDHHSCVFGMHAAECIATCLGVALDLHQNLQPLQRRHRCARPVAQRSKCK